MDPVHDIFRKKSYWKNKNTGHWCFYCPQCRAERKIALDPNPANFKRFFQVFLSAAVFTVATYQWFDLKGFVSFVPFWMIFESFYRTKVRSLMPCPHCGFDPYLYFADVKRARAEMEVFWRKRFEKLGIPYPEKGQKPGMPASGLVIPSVAAPVKANGEAESGETSPSEEE